MIPCKTTVFLDVENTQEHVITLRYTRDMISANINFFSRCGGRHWATETALRDMIRCVLMPGGSVPLPRVSVLLDQSKKPHDFNVINLVVVSREIYELEPPVTGRGRAGSLRRAIGDLRSDVRLPRLQSHPQIRDRNLSFKILLVSICLSGTFSDQLLMWRRSLATSP